MADEETEQDRTTQIGTDQTMSALTKRLQELATALKESPESPVCSASRYCQEFCEVLVEFAAHWNVDVDPLPLLEVYTEAILSYAEATPYLSTECENVSLILERLTLSCAELLLALTVPVPSVLWEKFQSSVQTSHSLLQQNGNSQLCILLALAQESSAWSNSTLRSILSNDTQQTEKVHEFLAMEGPVLLELRIKHLIKDSHFEKAALLAKQCAEYPEFAGRSSFTQTYLVCLCAFEPQEQLMQKISEVDCKDVLEMVCNLESDGDERGALSLCSAFLTRQLLQSEVYCAWELTLFWSKLLKRVEPSAQVFLDRCRHFSQLSKTVCHVLFLIKVIQAELQDEGLPVCIEMCIRALQMASSNEGNANATICKTISCLLPTDLEVKRACQLTEFLLEPTVDSYYAVEAVYNEPDQKMDEENLPVPNSLRCELLLVLKTQWPFDPEYWDWKALKRHCLALMGDQASIVSSVDELNGSKVQDEIRNDEEGVKSHDEFKDPTEFFVDTTNQLKEIGDERQKKREIKKLREKGFISARFRNWQAYVQYCVLCDKEFLGHRIVRHAQKHFSDGIYSCPICTTNFDTKEQLVPHVTSHVKQSCKERLASMKKSRALMNASKKTTSESSNQKTVENTSNPVVSTCDEQEVEHLCPVKNCLKSFKFFRNMMAHVKTHGDDEEAVRFLEIQSKKVVCNFCRRQFVSVAHLNDHLQMHCGDKPYICVQLNCKASFLSNAELLEHRKEHAVFRAKCMFPSCGRIFSEAYMLYDHEAQHYNTFTCKVSGCGKIFHTKSQLDLHQDEHVLKPDSLVDSDQGPLPDVKPGPPDQIDEQMNIDDEQNCPTSVNTGSSNPNMQDALQPLSSEGTNGIVTQQPSPVKIKHSIESLLSTTGSPTQGSEQNQSFKVMSTDSHLEQIPNSDNPVGQSSGYVSYSDQQGSENFSSIDVRQAGSQHQALSPVQNQNIKQEMQACSVADFHQSHAQNLASFPASDQNFQSLLPTQPQHWSYSQNQTPLPDQKLYSSEWSHPGSSQNLPCKSDVNETSQFAPQQESSVVNEARYSCTGVGPANPSCAFLDKQPVPGQVTPLMSNLIPAAPKCVVASVVSSQTAPVSVVGCGTPKNNPVVPEVAKERHYCPYETCTRNYSCSKSVTKHMKTAHPEFYIEWKLAKDMSKIRKIAAGKALVGLNKAAPEVHTQSTQSQQWSLGAICRNTPTSSSENLAENVLNPVLPQLNSSLCQTDTTWTGPMQASVNSSLLPLPAEKNSDTLTYRPSELSTPHLQSNFSNGLYSAEMNKPHTGVPSQTGTAHTPSVMDLNFNGNSSMDRVLDAQDTSSSFTMAQMHMGVWQNESQTAETTTGLDSGFHPAEKSYSNITSTSAHGSPLFHNISGAALPKPSSKASDPVFQSPVAQSSRLSELLSRDCPCPPHLANKLTSDAPHQLADEGSVHVSSCSHTTPPKTDGPPSFVLTPQRVVSSSLDSVKDTLQDQEGKSSNPELSWEGQNRLPSGLSSSERVTCSQMQLGLSFKGEALQSRANAGPVEASKISEQVTTFEVKKVKHDRRTKWPAIMKDGKYTCCRCFRQFESPKSLGGHLSKRSLCKDISQTDMAADLTAPSHDHKLQTGNAYRPAASNTNSNLPCKDLLTQSLSGTIQPVSSPNFTLTHANHSFREGKKDGETMKPFDSTPAAKPFEFSQVAQGPFQKPCDSHSSDCRLPEGTVIQHTGNLNLKTENEHCMEGFSNFKEPQVDSSALSHLPSPQVQKNFVPSLNTCPADHLNEILRAEALKKMRELKGNAGKSQHSGLSSDSLLAAIASLAQNLMKDPSSQVTSPDAQKLAAMLNKPLDCHQKANCEENIKKRLRDQILSGEFLRRGSVCQERGTDAVTSTESSDVLQASHTCFSGDISMATQKAANAECEAPHTSGATTTTSPSQSVQASPTHVNTKQIEGTSVICGASVQGKPTMNKDEDSTLPAGEDEKVMEIQRALQRLALDKETVEVQSSEDGCPPVRVGGSCGEIGSNVKCPESVDVDGTKEGHTIENPPKPFLCEKEGCMYGAMTKEALFKHLSRSHDYTKDMINELKKSPLKLSPYRCHLCTKTFTRNTNLRVHCETVHKLSREEFTKQKLLLQLNRKADRHVPEGKLSNNHNGSFRTDQSQNVSLNYATNTKSIDGMQKQVDLASQQSTGNSQEAIKMDYSSDTFKEQPTTAQSVSGFTKHLSVGEPVHSEEGWAKVVTMTGHHKEGQSIIRSPQSSQCLNVQHCESLARQHTEPAVVTVGPVAPESAQTGSNQAVISNFEKTLPMVSSPKIVKSRIENVRKTKEKKEKTDEADDVFSPYRPYRCVHNGCVAAFTIQQNLILHYKAVHQSALPKFDMDAEDDVSYEEENEAAKISEFRCQVKDCSRIFPQVIGLLQHYLQLHKFTMDKAGSLMSSINFGSFQCDQPECMSSFSAFQSYIEHIEKDHKMEKVSKTDGAEETFRCECDGCDRVYSTRSNVVRHIMKKHREFYKVLMRKQKKHEREQQAERSSKVTGVTENSGKENRENQKQRRKGSNKKRNSRTRSHWTSYGKPSLKSLEEASGMCTKKFPLQYPCMLKGCDSVMSSERNILRHYASHGLTERYIEEQRSGFIFCKKYSRARYKDAKKSDDGATETSEDDEMDETDNEESDVESCRDTSVKTESPELLEVKQVSEESSETKSVESVVIKRKRGRPRKVDVEQRKQVPSKSRKESLRNSTDKVNQGSKNTDRLSTDQKQPGQSEKTISATSFKPMGFEVSFLQFLENSAEPANMEKRKMMEDHSNEMPSKRRRTLQQRTVNIMCERPKLYRWARHHQNLVDFRNPLKLKSVKNVKIVVDRTFSNGAELLLKQLQEMRPMVVLKKWLYS